METTIELPPTGEAAAATSAASALREPTYEHYLTAVDGAVKRVARRYRLSPTDTEDLRSETWLKLLADPARTLGRFQGRAKLETYLTVVVRNLLFDIRDKERGKWRPSAAAKRLGPTAIAIDRLLNRDRVPLQAVREMTGGAVAGASTTVIFAIRAATARQPRRAVHSGALDVLPASDPSPFDLVQQAEARKRWRGIAVALFRALAALPAEDRRVVVSRYVKGQRIATPGAKDRRVYREFARILRRLRRSLEREGVDGTTVAAAFAETPPFEVVARNAIAAIRRDHRLQAGMCDADDACCG